MTIKGKLAAVGLALLLAGGAGSASAAPACATLTDEQVARDHKVIEDAMQAFGESRYAGLKRHAGKLKQVVEHMPADADELAQCGALPWPETGYPVAALLLGALNVELNQLELANAALARGLVVTPNDPMIATEAAHALVMSGKVEESRLLCDRLLGDAAVSDADRARLLRCRGFAFIELKRLDEAEADYRESLKFEPSNPTAMAELEVIAAARRGVAPGEKITVNSQTGQPEPAPQN